ncbi:PASTA domain-containing protein [Bifidobacterium pullorum subsp. saeculare]|uniref:non-specific serine/threonine protein kinase n=1 Tax=Bifidobacterium pullorum subsp. saeculare TaxID=78257 RepID=A0A939BA36_9BIFI|nr:Stk1 family PASTA domain-containing Ser/Thr kinase [Bifidobacterium pullorum]MBM6699486.1 PASTA domain-containing protein [Bifidobacterium pullorum subsp. saeculare]
MNEDANALTGRTIEGRYRVVSRIAEGGMATVYKAVDERLGRDVAIKVMHTQLAQGPHREQFVERFRREARSAAAIANPHIVQVYDTGEFDGLDYLVMEYVHGVNLRHEMNQRGTFDVRETVRILMETLDGLAAAHRAGVVHRDIKPENILVNDRGHVQITDFGLAKAASQATLSSTGMLLGTAAYLAPEMIERNEATPQGDLYSVGVMAWEMLAGHVPFVSDNPVTLVFKHVHEDVPVVSSVCPGIAPAVAAFVAHLTARAVEARPADASVALDELRRVASGLSLEDWQYRLQTGDTPVAPPVPPAPAVAPTTPMTAGATAPVAPADSVTTADPAATLAVPHADGQATQALGVDGLAAFKDGAGAAGGTGEGDGHGAAKRRRGGKALVIGLVVALVLAAGGGAGAWWYYLGPGSYWELPKPDDVTCAEGQTCRLTDADWHAYESTLKVMGVPYHVTEEYSDDVAEGDVVTAKIGRDEAAVGSHVGKRQPQRLDVVVSKGVRMATIPADILDPNSQAGKDPLAALKDAGFDNVRHDEANDQWSQTLPEGAAIAVSPDPGATVKHNDEVTVTLSKGPMPVSMPDIVGRTKAEAQQALDDLRLTANFTEEFSDTAPAGQVLSASVDKDTQLHWGDSVDVVVSKGPQMATVPDVRGQQYDDAAKTLEALGLKVQKSAPLGDLTHTVRLQDPGPGQQVRVRDANGKPTVVTLTVV